MLFQNRWISPATKICMKWDFYTLRVDASIVTINLDWFKVTIISKSDKITLCTKFCHNSVYSLIFFWGHPLQKPIFVVQKNKSIGSINCSLAMLYDDLGRRLTFFGRNICTPYHTYACHLLVLLRNIKIDTFIRKP